MPDTLDLGHGHTLPFTRWAPDRRLNPQYAGLPAVAQVGALMTHTDREGQRCRGVVTFRSPVAAVAFPGSPLWTVESLDPLTITPSIVCTCGDHGWIRQGRWVPVEQ